MPSSSKKVRDILYDDGDGGMINDFSLPEEHSQRFVSIDLGGNASVSTVTPGHNLHSTPGTHTSATAMNNVENNDDSRRGSNTKKTKAWERAIDKYVKSVLDNEKSSPRTSANSTAASRKSVRSLSNTNRSSSNIHPDNHLLDALRIETGTSITGGGGISSIPLHVDSKGRFDDSSFEPIDPYNGMDGGGGIEVSGKRTRQIRKMKQYIKDEWMPQWKPICLIGLVLLVTIIVSSSIGGGNDKDTTNSLDYNHNVGSTPESNSELTDLLTDIGVESVREAPQYPTYMPTATSPIESEATIVPATTVPATTVPTTTVPATLSPVASVWINPDFAPPPEIYTTLTSTTKAPTLSSTSEAPTLPPTTTAAPILPANYIEMKEAAMYVSAGQGFDIPSSPQILAFHWLYYEGHPSTNLFEFFEQYATAVLYFSLTQARTEHFEVVFDEWIETKEVCGWQGVRCAFNYTSEMVHVTEILLPSKNLTGTIPAELSFLPKVKRLDLSDNEIKGTVPAAVYGMKRLRHLFLNNNKLEGTISSAIDNLHMAEQIYLGQNKFVGGLPSNIGTNRPNKWRFFSVYNNQLSGPIPEGMHLNEAFMLDFSRNEFFGTIPSDISQKNYTTLRLLYMDHNKLAGTIPTALMQIKKLTGLFLNDNLLEGMLPYDILEETKLSLMTIRVQNNLLTLPVSDDICDLDVTLGWYELVELSVDCEICPSDCRLCTGRCY